MDKELKCAAVAAADLSPESSRTSGNVDRRREFRRHEADMCVEPSKPSQHINHRMRSIIVMAAVFVVFVSVRSLSAATFTVSNTNDSGPGSFRQAVLDANVNLQDDIVNFDAVVFSTPQTIVLTSGQISLAADATGTVAHQLVINGPGAAKLTVDGNNHSRIFQIETGGAITIDGLKLTHGNGSPNGIDPTIANYGGAINGGGGNNGLNLSSLTLKNSVVTGNSAPQSGGGLSVVNCTLINTDISHNTAADYAGGFFGTGYIINSTISYNTASMGSGIYVNWGYYLTVVNSTVAFNISTASSGGGGIWISDLPPTSNSHLSMINTIVANNDRPGVYGDIYGRMDSCRNCLIGSTLLSRMDTDLGGNLLNVDAKLTPTTFPDPSGHAGFRFAVDSPAIDAGSNCVLTSVVDGGCSTPAVPPVTVDYRGVARPQDGNGDGVSTVDIGSFEVLRSEVLDSPLVAPVLKAESDSGISNSDRITSDPHPAFVLTGIASGKTFQVSRDGIVVAGGVSDGSPFTFSDILSGDGPHFYNAQQIADGVVSLSGPSLTVVFDGTRPSASIVQPGQVDPTRVLPITFTVAFSEAVFGFDPSDISLAGSSAGVSGAYVSVTGSGALYAIQVSNVTSDGTVVVNLPQDAVHDIAGNTNTAATAVDNTVLYDTTAPTVAINQAAAQIDPTRSTPINFTVIFSEPVTGFTSADVSLAGSTANVASASKLITGSGTTYNVAVSGVSSNGGVVVATIPALGAQDTVGNLNVASTSTDNVVTLDNVSPTVTINQGSGQPDPTNQSPVNYTVIFSEPVTGFAANDVSLTSSSFFVSGAVITVTGGGTTYNVAVSNVSSNGGILRAAVLSSAAVDGLGNSSFASTSTDNSIFLDNIAPTVSINQAISQSDPAYAQPIVFQVFFNELVTGFTSADISLAGSTANVSAANVVVSGSLNAYTVSVSNILTTGSVKASVALGAAQDATGNPSLAATTADNSVSFIVQARSNDFDGDGRADASLFNTTTKTWSGILSGGGTFNRQFGTDGDQISPADYTGDGKTDIAVFRPSEGIWYILRSDDNTFYGAPFGLANDIPAPADYDGDGRSDIAVFRPSNGTWYIQRTTAGFLAVQFGTFEDRPSIGDFDGDHRSDIAVYRPSTGIWYRLNSSNGSFAAVQFGTVDDLIVPSDYTGDGKTDIAVFRPSESTWYILRSENNDFYGIAFGIAGDLPAPADYDGDGRADVAVWRSGQQGFFYIQGTASGFTAIPFGTSGYRPTANAYVY